MDSTTRETAQHIVNKVVTFESASVKDALTSFLGEVIAWTPRVPLVSRKDPAGACGRLLLESVELGETVLDPTYRSVVDVGSGAGFPGIVWAVLHPSVSFLLTERRERKAIFLERLVGVLALSNVTTFGGQTGSAARRREWKRSFDLAVAMAVGDPLRTALEVEPLLRDGAHFAITRPVGRPATELGRGFQLEKSRDGAHGRYAVYRLVRGGREAGPGVVG